MNYYQKYIKYKHKYIKLKNNNNLIGGTKKIFDLSKNMIIKKGNYKIIL